MKTDANDMVKRATPFKEFYCVRRQKQKCEFQGFVKMEGFFSIFVSC